ncbi:ABC transporter [Gracilaria domingensis]|nr:ABC transporter [Gracilaria domingensis]
MAGVLFIMCSMPIQSKLVGTIKSYREIMSARTDERVKFVAVAIKGINLVKLSAWELSFAKRILDPRTKELEVLRKMAILDGWNNVLVFSLPTILTIIVFTAYALFAQGLDAAVVFPAIAPFNVIKRSLMFLPNILISTARAAASLNRLRNFLVCEELIPLHEGDNAMDRDFLEYIKVDLAASNASFTWDPSISRACPTLSGVAFWIPEGMLVAVVGPTSRGESTLLAGLLGEVPIIDGEAGVRQVRSISFCDQVPFIQNAVVRDNILFGKPYDEASYRTAIRVCSILSDLKILPAGDLTESGRRGVNVSGGQRALVALVRSVYARSDICFLDDPLCAVDAHAGKSIFQDCIAFELRGTTKVLTTNQIHYAAAPEVDIVIVVKNGTVVEAGPRKELFSLDSVFSRMVKAAREVSAS